ncbi:AraC family transcriptional regulator [Acinetobacter sp.]|uniref:AraC family transcriptional regulator n=1 Tax=Acinetobacter sp. TaxID=472 RepID=UPI00388D060F
MNTASHFLKNSIQSSTQSIDAANQCLNQIIGPHELHDLSHEDPLNFSFKGEQMGGIIMGDLIYGKDVVFKTQHQQDMHFYCITRPKIGTPKFKQEHSMFEANQANAAIVSPFDKFEIEIAQNCVQSFISISKPLLEKTLSDLIHRPLNAPIEFSHTMSVSNEKIQAWWNLLDYLDNAHHSNLNFDCLMRDIRSDFEKIMVKSLLLSQPHNYSHLLDNEHNADPEFLKRALNYIHLNIHQNLHPEDLECITGVSKQKLSKAFRDRMQVSLNSYIRYYRLKCIYQELSKPEDKKNITHVAMKWGINHLGRFSIEYKQQFGESPSDTVRKSQLHAQQRSLS